jgi:peptidoglycan/LPS O-acetylase OafA/YrhL
MERFRGIEGMRGWLALIVLLAHLVTATGFTSVVPGLAFLAPTSGQAVTVFIIISGFVIAHLRLSRGEPYPLYIARRALRLYPVYLVCLLLGLAVQWMTRDTAGAVPWLDPDTAAHIARGDRELANGDLPIHLAAHLTLLHGAISNNLLDETQFMFLGPSWSLSLEWQFYLIAPLAVVAFQRRYWNLVALAAVALGHVVFIAGWLGHFYTPSVLPAAGAFFAIGILCRLHFDRLPRLRRFPILAVLGLILLAILLPRTAYLAGWAIVLAYLLTAPGSEPPRLLRLLLDTRLARALGARSFVIYLLHQPVISAVTAWGAAGLQLGPVPLFLFVCVVSAPAIALGTEAIHRWIELPGIAFGRRLGGAVPCPRIAL